MAHFLSQQRERIASCIIGAILLMPLCLYWKQSTTHIVITAFFIIVYILIASIGAIRFSDLLPALCIASLAWAFTAIRWHWPEMIERGSWISALFGDSSSESYFAFVVPVLLGWSLAWSLSRPIEKILARISKHRKFSALAIRYRFAGNIGFSLLLSTICAVVALLNHWSFQTNAIDYGLFDQVIYLLSRFSTPTSTVMQINNIFLDHQHFSSLILTAPFYWIGKGFHGATLAAIVPYMLITLPSILFYLIAKTIAAHHYSHTSRPYWVIGITSFLLSIHPFTQSAINFYFHEKYWMPIFFLALIYCGLQYLYKKKILFLVAGILSALIWAMLKEDQWIFVFVATLTSFVVGMFVLRVSHVRKRLMLFCGMVTLFIIGYAIFLQWFSQYTTPKYREYYNAPKEQFREFFQHRNVGTLVKSLNIIGGSHQEVVSYLYQNFLAFDAVGVVPFGLNIAGNYTERILPDANSLKNPIFQYGADVPIYTICGILFFFLWLQRKKPLLAKRFLLTVVCAFILNFAVILGWENTYYLFPSIPKTVYNFQQTAAERQAMHSVRKLVPDNASLVATHGYVPHFSARKEIGTWAYVGTPPKNIEYYIDYDSYEYWLLAKNDEPSKQQIEELRKRGYVVLMDTEWFVLLQKP